MSGNQTTGTRKRILEAALNRLSSGGYGSVSMQKVADAAGVTKPTIYYHFSSKQGLFSAMFEQVMSELHQLVRRELSSTLSVREGVEKLLDVILYSASPGPRFARVNLAFSMDPGLRSKFPWVRERMSELSRLLERLLEKGVMTGELRRDLNVRFASEALISIVRTYLLEQTYGGQAGHPIPPRDEILSVLFHGISHRKGDPA